MNEQETGKDHKCHTCTERNQEESEVTHKVYKASVCNSETTDNTVGQSWNHEYIGKDKLCCILLLYISLIKVVCELTHFILNDEEGQANSEVYNICQDPDYILVYCELSTLVNDCRANHNTDIKIDQWPDRNGASQLITNTQEDKSENEEKNDSDKG